MIVGQRIMDAKTKTIYRVARIEEDLIILAAEDESEELVDNVQDIVHKKNVHNIVQGLVSVSLNNYSSD